MTYDHINPRSKGGDTTFENICLTCRSCNEFKSDLTKVKDPPTGEIVSLFNPRTQKWTDHFSWSLDWKDKTVTHVTKLQGSSPKSRNR